MEWDDKLRSVAIRGLELRLRDRIRRHFHAFIIKNNLILSYIVIYQHLFTAHHSQAAHLDGIQPADPQVGDHIVTVPQIHINHLIQMIRPIDIGGSQGADFYGIIVQDIAQDGQVVWRQVPHHIDIGLQQAEVDTGCIHVVNITQFS